MTREEAIKIMEQRECCMECVVEDFTCKDCDTAFEMAIKALEQQTCEDAVSREAVLDIFADNADATRSYSTAWEKIRDLPSVNPQPKTRWIPVSESERLPKGSDIVLLSLPPHIAPDGEECSASVICGHYIGGKNKEWGLSDGDTFGYGIVSVRKGTNPIAWMPSPKPYEPQESEG